MDSQYNTADVQGRRGSGRLHYKGEGETFIKAQVGLGLQLLMPQFSSPNLVTQPVCLHYKVYCTAVVGESLELKDMAKCRESQKKIPFLVSFCPFTPLRKYPIENVIESDKAF